MSMGVKEDKPNTPKKPFIYYYTIMMVVLMALNLFLMPMYRSSQVTEVPYSTFLDILRSSRKCLKYLCRNFLCISCSAGIYHLIFQHCILLSIDAFPLVSFYWCDIY